MGYGSRYEYSEDMKFARKEMVSEPVSDTRDASTCPTMQCLPMCPDEYDPNGPDDEATEGAAKKKTVKMPHMKMTY